MSSEVRFLILSNSLLQLSFYKNQNSELIFRLDEFELCLDQHVLKAELKQDQADCEIFNALNQDYKKSTQLFKGERAADTETIS
jgi:hypothetical protein